MIPVLLLAASLAAGQAAPTAEVEGVLFAPNVPMSGAVVSLVPVTGGDHPEGLPPDTTVMDQQRLRFMPSVLVGRPGLVVEFRNGDPILHNVFSPPRPGPGFNLGTYGRTERRARTFLELGAHTILCHIHPEMVAYVVIVPTTLHVLSDRRGQFRFAQVPPGTYDLQVWHPFVRPFTRRVTVPPGDRLSLTIDLEPSGRY